MSEMLQPNYPPTDDGTEDVEDAHEAWHQIEQLKRDRWLLPVEIDYKAAAIESGLWAKGMHGFALNYATRVVNAALGIIEGGDDEDQ